MKFPVDCDAARPKVVLFLVQVVSFGVPFFLLQIFPIPGEAIRKGLGIELSVVFLLLFWLLKKHGRYAWIPDVLIFMLFGLNLASLWLTPNSDWQVAGGSLLFSDASRYYADALRLPAGFPYTSFSARHPLPTLYLSSLLFLTGMNLKFSLGLTSFLAALVTRISTVEVRKRWGNIAAAIFCLMMFLFYRRFSGLPDSENLGFILGTLSFVYFLSGLDLKKNSLIFQGFFLLVAGLLARPGTMFLIPAFFLWGWFEYRHLNINRYRFQLVSLLCVIITLGISLAANHLLGERGGRLFSNYAYTFYGISSGGTGWEQFSVDHSDTSHKPDLENEDLAFINGWNILLREPSKTWSGVVKSYLEFFSTENASVFGFVTNGEVEKIPGSSVSSALSIKILRAILLLLGLAGILYCITKYRDFRSRFFLFTGSGILLSVFFLPPSDTAMMRVYAASMPFILIFPILGINLIRSRFVSESDRFIPTTVETHAKGAGLFVLLLCCLPFLFSFRPKVDYIKLDLPSCPVQAIIRVDAGSYLHLSGNSNEQLYDFYAIRLDAYQTSLLDFPKQDLRVPLSRFSPGSFLFTTIDLRTGQQIWVIFPKVEKENYGHPIRVCGEWNAELFKTGLGFLEVAQIFPEY